MKLGNLVKMVVASFVMAQASVCMALEIYDTNYIVEEYARYTSRNFVSRIVFDSDNNLYVAERNAGRIIKMSPDNSVSLIASGFDKISDITISNGGSYGNNLYVLTASGGYNDYLYKVNTSGGADVFAYMDSPYHGPSAVEIDASGYYGNQMFVGTSSLDRVVRVTTNGDIHQLVDWQGSTSGGSIKSVNFDINGNYDNSMYVGTDFNTVDAGIYKVNVFGEVEKFSTDSLRVEDMFFDETGAMFGNKLYALGKMYGDTTTTGVNIWQIDENGDSELFGNTIRAMTFGNDGAMYFAENVGNEVIISRVATVPEPGVGTLMVLGAAWMRKRLRMR